MPRYDDVKAGDKKKVTNEPEQPKKKQKMNFSEFLDAMAAIKQEHE